MMSPKDNTPKKHKLRANAEAYGNRSTVHGVGYICDPSIAHCDRILWLGILILLSCVATKLVYQSYCDWQDNPVITTLSTVAKPVTSLSFPAITICGAGQHMDNVEKVLYQDFKKWNSSQSNNKGETSLEERFAAFLKERFQIKEKGMSLMDILNTMVAPSDEAADTNSVRRNQIACNKTKNRGKRSIYYSIGKERKKRGSNSDILSMYF